VRSAAAIRAAINRGLLSSAHDCSLGGLAVTLAESALLGGIGARVKPPLGLPDRPPPSWHFGLLFGESQGRYLVSLEPSQLEAVRALFVEHGTSFSTLGQVGGSVIAIEGLAEVGLEVARSTWAGAIPERLEPARAARS
jgi:phosphoribosylformylglycinamidine synthase